jgi:hypothetical protein
MERKLDKEETKKKIPTFNKSKKEWSDCSPLHSFFVSPTKFQLHRVAVSSSPGDSIFYTLFLFLFSPSIGAKKWHTNVLSPMASAPETQKELQSIYVMT